MLSSELVFATQIFYLFFLLACLAVGTYCLRYLPRGLACLVLLLAVTLVTESTGLYMLRHPAIKDDRLFVIYQIFEYLLLSGYFLSIIVKSGYKKAIYVSCFVITGLNLLILSGILPLKPYNNRLFLLAAILLIIWSVVYLFELFRNISDDDVGVNPNFWICGGIIFFYAGSFFIVGLIQLIVQVHRVTAWMFTILMILLNCILYGLMTYGLTCALKKPKSS